jgi:hypothetical protein
VKTIVKPTDTTFAAIVAAAMPAAATVGEAARRLRVEVMGAETTGAVL